MAFYNSRIVENIMCLCKWFYFVLIIHKNDCLAKPCSPSTDRFICGLLMSELCSSERTTFVCIFSDTPKIFYSRSIHSVEGQIDPFSSQRKINKLKSVLAGHPLKLFASQSPVTSKTKASARASLSCMCSASLFVHYHPQISCWQEYIFKTLRQI